MIQRFFFLISSFLFLCLPLKNTEALDLYVKVHVLSRYALEEVTLETPLARVRIADKEGGQEILWPPDLPLLLKAVGKKVEVKAQNRAQVDRVVVEPPRGGFVAVKLGSEKRKFGGKLTIRSVEGALFFVEEMLLEKYVRGVLEAEMPQGFPPEAVKAQAVLIRTYALAHLDRHVKEGFNFCDLTHCQVYGGINFTYRSLEEAVQETRSTILAYNFKPMEALYHSTCGGHTSPNQKVFGGEALPYLQGVDDEKFCAKSPHYVWENTISLKILEEVLKKDPKTHPKGEITNIKAVDREEKGRVFRLALEGKQYLEFPAVDFMSVVGRYLGWSHVKSNWFDVEVKEGEAHFKGRGLGHGVGFCQWGAKGMAEAGKKMQEILFHYFPGTHLVQR